jgi:hypothetical protein
MTTAFSSCLFYLLLTDWIPSKCSVSSRPWQGAVDQASFPEREDEMLDEMQEQPDHVERMHNELQAAVSRELFVAPLEPSKGNIDTFTRAWLEDNSITLPTQTKQDMCAFVQRHTLTHRVDFHSVVFEDWCYNPGFLCRTP